MGIEIHGLENTISNLEEYRLKWGEFVGKAVVSDVEYAVYVEFGTYKMDANRGLRDSMEETMNQVDSLAEQADSAEELGDIIAESIAEGWRDKVWVDTGRLRDSITVVETT